MPTRRGSGASNISIRGWGNIGTKARHHLKGYSNEFKPRIAEESYDCWPMNTIDFSRSAAEINFVNVLRGKRANNVGQNQMQSA